MRAIKIEKPGEDYRLVECQLNMPDYSSEQVLIQVSSFGLNRADVLQAMGNYPAPEGHSPIPGLEVTGVVIKQGDSVVGNWLGERVCCIVSGGGYAEYAVVHASHLIKVPVSLSEPQAAGFAEVFLTAYQALFPLARLQAGQSVLVHAGASGVGLAAIQLAKLKGLQVVVTASSDQKLALCKRFGADTLINYKQESFATALKKQGRRVDAVVDVVGGNYCNDNLRCLNMDGTIVQLAILGGRYVDRFDLALMLSKRARLIATTLRNRSDAYKGKLVQDFCTDFLQAMDNGELMSYLSQPAGGPDQLTQFHQLLRNNQTSGKLVISWD